MLMRAPAFSRALFSRIFSTLQTCFDKLLKLVIDWDASRARGGELAIYNNLVISVPVDEE